MTRVAAPPSANWLSVGEVSADLGFTTRTIRRMAKQGKFKSAQQWGGRWLFSRKVYENEMHGLHQEPSPIAALEALKGEQ